MGFSYVKPLPVGDRCFTPHVDKTYRRQPNCGTDAKSQIPGDQDPATAQRADPSLPSSSRLGGLA